MFISLMHVRTGLGRAWPLGCARAMSRTVHWWWVATARARAWYPSLQHESTLGVASAAAFAEESRVHGW